MAVPRTIVLLVAVIASTVWLPGGLSAPTDEGPVDQIDGIACQTLDKGLEDPCPSWVASYDGPASEDDHAKAVAVAPDGAAVYVTGTSDGDFADFATAGYDATTGAEVWTARYDGAGSYDRANDIAVSPDGSRVFVVGSSIDETNDVVTIAYDAGTGDQLWLQRFDGPDNGADRGKALVVSPDGAQVYVTGSSSSSATGSDYITVAYDAASGQPIWTASYDGGSQGFDKAVTVDADPNGDRVYVSGAITTSTTGNDFATLAYDSQTGALVWAAHYDGPAGSHDEAVELVASTSGIYVTGVSRGDGTERDYATVGYDPATGAQAWVARYDDDQEMDRAYGIAMAPDGATVYVTGQSRDASGFSDYATVAYEAATGLEVWSIRSDGGVGIDTAYAIDASDERVFVTGFSRGDGTSYDHLTVAYDPADGQALWVARYDGPASSDDRARDLVVSPDGSAAYVTGAVHGGFETGYDYGTMVYEADGGSLLGSAGLPP